MDQARIRQVRMRAFLFTTEFTEDTEVLLSNITDQIIGAAITVHREIGPGLLESAYQTCFGIELDDRNMRFEREVPLSLVYNNRVVPNVYRIDFIVEGQVIVELKSVDKLAPIHTAQLITYQKLTKCRVGLLFNFNIEVLVHGMRRIAL
ncbi:MAG TPA: GxxExxY protein [Longimicrobiales bacterium]